MRREPLVYGVLLVAALAVAFRTWIHDDKEEAGPGSIPVWSGQPDAIVGIEYISPEQHLEVLRQGAPGATYLWGTQDSTAFRIDAGAGQRMLGALAAPRAIRDLGAPDARAREAYGLDSSRTRIVVRFRDGSRELVLGETTFARQGDRYVFEPRSGHVYVVPSSALPQFTDAVNLLLERQLHGFPRERLASVTVSASGRNLTLHRIVSAAGVEGWTSAADAARPDSVLTSFMQKVDFLSAASYAAREDPRSMNLVARVDYYGRDGKALGFMELFRRKSAAGTPQYFVRSEVTGVLVRLFPGVGEGVEGGLPALWRDNSVLT